MAETLQPKHKVGTGIQPQTFIEGMTRNQEEFLSWYNRFSWKEEDKAFFEAIGAGKDVHCLILCTDWCPDVIWNVPVLFRALEQSPITVEVLLMEQHLETMDLFLTDGGRGNRLPYLLMHKAMCWGNGDRALAIFRQSWRISGNRTPIGKLRTIKKRFLAYVLISPNSIVQVPNISK